MLKLLLHCLEAFSVTTKIILTLDPSYIGISFSFWKYQDLFFIPTVSQFDDDSTSCWSFKIHNLEYHFNLETSLVPSILRIFLVFNSLLIFSSPFSVFSFWDSSQMQDLSTGPLIFLSFLLFYCLFSQFSGDFLIYLFNSSDFF